MRYFRIVDTEAYYAHDASTTTIAVADAFSAEDLAQAYARIDAVEGAVGFEEISSPVDHQMKTLNDLVAYCLDGYEEE